MQKRKIVCAIVSSLVICSLFHFGVQNTKADEDSDAFVLWVVGDPCGSHAWGQHVDYNEGAGTWSGDMIDSTIDHIDLSVLMTDIATGGSGVSAASWRTYINTSVSNTGIPYDWDKAADDRKWAFVVGNHDIGGGSNNLIDGMGEGLGLYTNDGSPPSWINWSTQWGRECNYTIQRGNLLFLIVSGDLSNPSDGGGAYQINYDGTMDWLESTIHDAHNDSVNVIVFTHRAIFNASQAIRCTAGTNLPSYPAYWNASTGWNDIVAEPSDWYQGFEDSDYDNTIPDWRDRAWDACNGFYDILNQSWNSVGVWFGSDCHTRPNWLTMHDYNPEYDMDAWDSFNGTGRNIQKAPQCVFMQSLNAFAHTNPSLGWSRVVKFVNGSKDIIIRTYQHHSTNGYMNDADFYSSGKDITITNALKFDYNPSWPGDAGQDTNITFSSINGEVNNSVLQEDNRTFKWNIVSNATSYSIRVSNFSDFHDEIFLQLDNVSLSEWGAGYYSEANGNVTFILPDQYNITTYGYHYYQVRAYTS